MPPANVFWTGASGKKYGYWSKDLPYYCDPGQNGNYIFAKINNGEWIPVYIGQGDIGREVNDETHYLCAITRGATHVHVHTNHLENARVSEEQDLLTAHPCVYRPDGCNQKT